MKTFESVAQLKLAKLKDGQQVTTKGYYTAGDGGGAKYLIKTPQAFDGYGDHELANSNCAELQQVNMANVLQYGAKNDNTDDIAPALQAAIDNNEKVYIPDGEYAWATQVNLIGNRQITFSQGAILRPTADNFIMLKHENALAAGSNILIENMFASDFGGTSVGVTMISLADLGAGVEIKSPKATQLDTMIDIVADSFGVKIYSPSCFRVPYPIKSGSGGSVGTVDVYSPNFDNSVAVAGGSGLGIGIDFTASGSVYGGYIQGFDTCVKFGGRGTVHATYFESANNEAVLFDGAFGVTCVNTFFFGFEGDACFRGRNSEGISIRNPVMVNSGATTGLFDFDNTNKGCTYEYVTNDAETINPVVGITTGISSNTLNNNASKVATTQKNIAPTTPTACFRVEVPFPSSNRIEVSLEAIERTGNFGCVSKKFAFLIRRGGATTISTITDILDFTSSVSSGLYNIDAVLTAVEVEPAVVEVSIEITSTGSTTPSSVDFRANIEVSTSEDSLNVWEV